MIISDLSIFEAVEDSAHIEGGLFLPIFTGANGSVTANPTNSAFSTASAIAQNRFSSGPIQGVSSSATQTQTNAFADLGGGSESNSLSAASIGFVDAGNGAPLLIAVPLKKTNP